MYLLWAVRVLVSSVHRHVGVLGSQCLLTCRVTVSNRISSGTMLVMAHQRIHQVLHGRFMQDILHETRHGGQSQSSSPVVAVNCTPGCSVYVFSLAALMHFAASQSSTTSKDQQHRRSAKLLDLPLLSLSLSWIQACNELLCTHTLTLYHPVCLPASMQYQHSKKHVAFDMTIFLPIHANVQ